MHVSHLKCTISLCPSPHSCATQTPNYCKLNQSHTMATEGCQFGQERIYLNVTRVSFAQLPGGDVERVCLWLPCPLTYMPHAPQTIANSSFPLSVCSKSQGKPSGMKSSSTLSYVRRFAKKHTYTMNKLCYGIFYP